MRRLRIHYDVEFGTAFVWREVGLLMDTHIWHLQLRQSLLLSIWIWVCAGCSEEPKRPQELPSWPDLAAKLPSWPEEPGVRIQWEGEAPTWSDLPVSDASMSQSLGTAAQQLSGGDWLCFKGHQAEPPPSARYQVSVAQGSDYRFWARRLSRRGPFEYRFDDQPFRRCGAGRPLADRTFLTKDIEASWVDLGHHFLSQGEHVLEVRPLVDATGDLFGCFDTFVLASNSNDRPSETTVQPAVASRPGSHTWFPVTFDDDVFSSQSVIDMSQLVEAPAGQHGFLQRSGAELRFEHSDQAQKFWAVNAHASDDSDEDMVQRARYLRKHGVNMVREHPLQDTLGLLDTRGEFDAKRLERWDRWFFTLKQQGLYMTWSPFYPHRLQRGEGYDLFDELPGEGDTRSVAGLVNVEPALQASEWRWLKTLLLHKNPYTGLRYVDDPALAVLEIHNEDSIFWHYPLNGLAEGDFPKHLARLQARWAAWLRSRYKSDANLAQAWGAGWLGLWSGMRPHDSLDNAAMPIYSAREMGAHGPVGAPRARKRMGDFIRFLAEKQRGYYEDRIAQLRALGFRGVTITTAWRAGGPAADAANLWTDTAADMISRHTYVGGGAGRHLIAPGRVDMRSQLAAIGSGLLAMGLYQVQGHPFCMTEWSDMPPNPWKFEAAPIVAFYGLGLQGWDAAYHFTSSGPRMGDGWPQGSNYVSDTPHYMGQFPALSFAIAHQHVRQGDVVAARRVSVDELFQGYDPLGQDFTAGGHDDKRLKREPTTPLSLLALGQVTVGFDGGRSYSTSARVGTQHATEVKAITDQLLWSADKQQLRICTDKTQGLVGRTSSAPIDLPSVTLRLDTPAVSLLLTPLDDRPLRESRHVLITALARDRQQGSIYAQRGSQLLDKGSPVLWLEPVVATLRLRGDRPTQVRALDQYGVFSGNTVPIAEDGSFRIDGRYQAYYYEVVR